MKTSPWIAGLAGLAVVAGCSQREPILEGERFDVRAALEGAAAEASTAPLDASSAAPSLSLPAQTSNASWTHVAGSPGHGGLHAALSRAPAQIWSARIGGGEGRRARITADPVVLDGRVFTIDSGATVTATSTSGSTLWARDMTPPTDRTRDASGGGLAVNGTTLYVTTGFGQLSALDVASGEVRWVQDFDGPVQGAPTVSGDLVYVVGRESRAFAVRADNGRLAWELPGTPTPSVTTSGAAPAVTDRFVIFPFGAAEMVATLRQGGIRVWGATVAGERRGRSYTGFSDITGAPVVSGDRVYASTPSGRVVALKLSSGERIWTATEGALSPVLPVGGSVFLVSDEAKLVRLDAETGEPIWSVDLPYFKKEKPRRRKAVFANYGPVLAGGLLRIASDDGQLRSYDPRTGALVTSTDIPGGATTNPVVAGGTLYVVSTRGQLHAFR